MNMANKNIPEELRKLANNRALILLVELMGFLHDVGKLSSNLYENHYKRWDEEDSKEFPKLKEIFEKPFSDLLEGKIEEEILEKVKTCQLRGFQRHHTEERYRDYWPKNWIEEAIHLADSKDSSEDRGKAISKQEPEEFIAQVFGRERKFFVKNKEELNIQRKNFLHNLQSLLEKFYNTLNKKTQDDVNLVKSFIEFHRKMVENIETYFVNVPGFTMRAANDVSLFSHSYMTGSIAKSLVAKCIISDDILKRIYQQIIRFDAEINKDKSSKEKEIYEKILKEIQSLNHFDDECNLDLLLVYFDSLSFLSQSQNLLDIRGRVEILKQVKEEIKSLIEVEYPLGNCIYEDEDNLCFLIPPISNDSFEFIRKKIFNIFNERTKGLLLPVIERKEKCKFYGKALVELKEKCKERRYEKLITNDFIPSWTKEWNNSETRDVCILCGKMPQLNGKEKDYLCEFCWEVRYRIGPKEDKRGTSWIDEITDENGKIALIVGAFQPLDKWLSGEFLKYQKIRTLKDIGEESLPTFEEASRNFVENFYKIMEKEGDFKRFLGRHIYELELEDSIKKVIGGRSFVGEIYYRLSPQSQELLKKKKLEEIEIDKISKEIVEIVTTKPPSPSRLFRIWRELEEFSKLEGILKEIPKGLRLIFEGEDLKEKLDGNVGFYVLKHISSSDKTELGEISCYWDGKKLSTVERIDKENPSDEVEEKVLKAQRELANKLGGKEMDIVLKEEKSKKEVGKFRVKVNIEEYESYRRIISSPRGFMLIVPANKAFEISKRISEEFHQHFSKSLGKLSLNIGIVFSHRKMPIFALLDAGRRFINEFSQEEPKMVFISEKHVSPEGHEVLSFKINKTKVPWKIDTKLGDGKEDYYYPYFISSEDKPLYILEVVPNKPIKAHLNKFDFEYLDSNIRRFDIIINESGKRQHVLIGKFGSRPYLLEDLEKLQKLMDIFKIIGSWVPIRDIEAITAEKRKEWSETYEWENIEEEYEEFIDAVLENKISNTIKRKLGNWEDNKNFLKDCIMEGSFFDAIELFGSIMKMKFGGEKNE